MPIFQKGAERNALCSSWTYGGRTYCRTCRCRERTHELTTWEKAPNGKVVKTDVSIAKNYLKEEELESMGRLVNAFLDLAEDRAKRHIPMTMEDWAKRIDKFLDSDDRPILNDSGKMSVE